MRAVAVVPGFKDIRIVGQRTPAIEHDTHVRRRVAHVSALAARVKPHDLVVTSVVTFEA